MIRWALSLMALGLLVWCPRLLGAPPEVSVGTLPSNGIVGQSFDLTLDIRWEGVDRRIQIVGMDPGAASPFEMGQAKHSQRRSGDVVDHTLTLSLTPTLPGEVLLGPVALLYQEGDTQETYRLDLPGTYPISVTSGEGNTAWQGLVLGGMVLVALGVVVIRQRLKRKHAPGSDVEPKGVSHQEALQSVKRLAGRGEWGSALGEMAPLISALSGAEGAVELPSLAEVKEEGQRLRYGGGHANTQKIERWLRALERCVRAQAPTE